ncbi:electron transport complex subunit RsxB [Advenella mimigardefordensis]|uniref:Putative electron transport complex protein RnfB n=1 Tax=Advenella mimigardefordensis (strain DSM 17166 / LMG 22922 / DPN7) TaxID=1247726 RepID=W0PG41_ADVMD|nr:electron transport complex subunit RsxB [Advenella mimigardefordensis]AHG64492.1 putative electron transport complex protein RnfB [Advenella mimigardefordensis DPN7]
MTHALLIDRIDAVLPQTQCTQCGFDGCRPYAQALAAGTTLINRCPPGGDAGIEKLAAVLDTPVLPLDESCGQPGPLLVAVIDESHCIGCTLCIQACPVDAIMGANKFMHTIIPDLCSGCELCIAPCPVDCISMEDAQRPWTPDDANAARTRHEQRALRLQRNAQEKEDRMRRASAAAARTSQLANTGLQSDEAQLASEMATSTQAASPQTTTNAPTAEDAKKAAIALALQRARARRKTNNPSGSTS